MRTTDSFPVLRLYRASAPAQEAIAAIKLYLDEHSEGRVFAIAATGREPNEVAVAARNEDDANWVAEKIRYLMVIEA